MKIIRNLVLILLIFSGVYSCTEIEKLPAIPSIEYRGFNVFDTVDILGNSAKGGRLSFYFEDGDGDLGLNVPEAPEADTTNIYFTLYRKSDGVLVPAPENDPLKPSAYRIPFMEKQGQNQILKGTISITFLYMFYSPSDTIVYEFYIKDRALNLSNTVSTNEIVISENGKY